MANPEKFYKSISGRCGFMDVKSVSEFYFGMVRHILAELKTKGTVHLPSFGKFVIVKYKGKECALNGGGYVEPTKNVRFAPSAKFKNYVNNRM